MSHHVKFHKQRYVIPDDVIPGNSSAATPCAFDLSMANDADLARIKAITLGKIGLSGQIKFTPSFQAAVMKAFETGKDGFVRTVDKVEGLTIDASLARKVDLLPQYNPEANDLSALPDDAQFPIVNGYQFSRVAPYLITIGFLVAVEISKLTDKANIDPRFFEQLSGSSTGDFTKKSTAATSTVPSAFQPFGSKGTAANQKAKPASRRNGTSGRKSSRSRN